MQYKADEPSPPPCPSRKVSHRFSCKQVRKRTAYSYSIRTVYIYIYAAQRKLPKTVSELPWGAVCAAVKRKRNQEVLKSVRTLVIANVIMQGAQ